MCPLPDLLTVDLKPLIWMASSRKDLRRLPTRVRRVFGLALYGVQAGERPLEAKPLSGFGGAAVLELKEDDSSGTYRAIYTVRFTSAVYVLHVFQKKSRRGIATPKADLDLIRERLKVAEQVHATAMRTGNG